MSNPPEASPPATAANGQGNAPATPSSPIADTLSTLSDRGLRRLLGARTFLRGLEYARRKVVEEITLSETAAEGKVKGPEIEPFVVRVMLTPEGIKSMCTCPVFAKSQQHCKHVAALLISVRDQARGAHPRPSQQQQQQREQGQGRNQAGGTPGQQGGQPSQQGFGNQGSQAGQGNQAGLGNQGGQGSHGGHAGHGAHGGHGGGHGGHGGAPQGSSHGNQPSMASMGDGGPNSQSRKSSRKERRAQRLVQLQSTPSHVHSSHHGGHALPSHTTSSLLTAAPPPDASAKASGIGAWLPPQGAAQARPLEFRVLVRSGGLTVTAFDPENRVPILPSLALSYQAFCPTPDREALRVLARFESGNVRHPAVDIRGEDVAELLPHLVGRRVLLEPTLMQLRYADEPLRPRFELELSTVGVIEAKVCFERPGEKRKFNLSSGGWFEGSPGWHIDTNEGIARPIDRRVSPAALKRLIKTPKIDEPASELVPLIMDALPRVALEVGAELPSLDQVADVVDLIPTFRMHAGGSLTDVLVSLSAVYGDVEVPVRADGISPPIILQKPEGQYRKFKCIRCDIPAQQAAAERLSNLGLQPDETGQKFTAQGDRAIRFWSEGLGSLPEDWDLFVPEDLVDTQVRQTPITPQARVSSGVDWLSLKLTFESEGISVSRDELIKSLAEGRKYVRLDDGSFAAFDADHVRALLDREIELLTSAGKGGKIPLSQAGRLQELLGQIKSTSIAGGAQELFKKLAGIEGIEIAKKPRALKAQLRPYQEAGLSWLRFIHDIKSGGILADDMGLGKTLQTISLLCSVKQDEKKLRALIVAPTSVVPNWAREIERFAPTLKTMIWHGADRHEQRDELEAAEVVITSYPLLRRDEELLSGVAFDYAILDEAQHIKNPLSATAAAAKKLSAERRLALTGTPIENRLSEFWSIFDYVSPRLLDTLDKFEERYARPIDNGDGKVAARLRSVVHPFILRRTKLEVEKDLPEKIETDQICEMTEEQRAIYTSVLREVRAQVMGEVEKNGLAKSQLHILAGLTRLRQAACDPRLLGLPKTFEEEVSGKLNALRELIEECVEGGHKVLLFSQFVQMLQLIKTALDRDKVVYEYLDGSTKDRQERVDRFQNDPTCSVFLISLKAGGTGLNLTAADTVIHFDPWWNPAVEDQATDRAHRIGQSRVVTVYRLVSQGTIEEKILQLKSKKRELVASVLSEDMGGSKKLTKADIEDLFTVD